MINTDLFEPFERLIEIEICGKKAEVPENNTILRCFQYLALEKVSYGDFCWNGECANCQVWYEVENNENKGEKPVLACRTEVSEGMKIVKLSDEMNL